MKQHKKKLAVVFFILTLSVCIFLIFAGPFYRKKEPRGKLYVGSESCKSCHQSIYDGYMNTAHYNASKLSSKDNINGSFRKGENMFNFSCSTMVMMKERDSGFYQVSLINGVEKEAHRFDITFGEKNGQTYLYWKGDKCFQLPISYYNSIKRWGTSPGFSPAYATFNRQIGKSCFECHTSYINSKIDNFNTRIEVLDRSSLINGIDCERCHGGAANHVNYHQAYPKASHTKYLVTAQSLTRQQKLDMCAVCHSGTSQTKEISTFYFKLGDTLSKFFLPLQSNFSIQNKGFDVHGKQLQLLASSACFIKSKTLTCTTCHNPHANASADLNNYVAKCITCHKNTNHSFDNSPIAKSNLISNTCIDCHMPKLSSKAITFQVSGRTEKTSQFFRTHKIGIYNSETKKVAVITDFIKKISKS